jgi:hypothetical protein
MRAASRRQFGNREALSVYLDPPQKKALDALARKRGVKLARLMREVVDSFLGTMKGRSP